MSLAGRDVPPGQSDISRMIRIHAGRTPIVGRDRELAILDAARDAVVAGETRAVMLVGEAGIGKSRLLRAVCERESSDEGAVLFGQCVDEHGMPPFLPWIDALSRIAREDSDLADLRNLLLGIDQSEPDRAVWMSPEQRKLRVFAAVSDAMGRHAEAHPVLIGLDDLQWSDAATNELLRHVLVHGGTTRLLVIGAYRSDEAMANRALQRTIEDLHRRRLLTMISLGPLAPEDIERLVATLTGRPDTSLSRAIHRHCEGNPFFVEEVLQQMADDGQLPTGSTEHQFEMALPVPRSVVAVIKRRLEQLSPQCRAILEVAAIAGSDISIDLLATVTDAEPDAISNCLDEASRLALLRSLDSTRAAPQDADGGDQLSFAHDRIRESIDRTIGPLRRRDVHGRIARAMAQSAPMGMDPRHLSAITHHFRLASLDEEAARYAEQLGDAAMRSHAHSSALEAYRIAIRHAVAGTPISHQERTQATLQVKLGDALLATGDDRGAIEAFAAAEQAFASLDDTTEHAQVLRRLGVAYARQEKFDQSVAYLQAAIGSLRPDDGAPRLAADDASDGELALTLVELGSIQGTSLGRYQDGIDIGRRGLSLAVESASNRHLVPYAQLSLAKTLMRAGDLQEGNAVLEPALPLALRNGDYDLAAEIVGALANFHYWTGDLEASGRAAHQRHDLAKQAGDPFALRHTSAWLAHLALARGEWEEAERHLAEAEAQTARVDSPEPRAFVHMIRGHVHFQMGQYHDAVSRFEEALRGFRNSGPTTVTWYVGCLALAYLEAGDKAKLARTVEEARQIIAKMPTTSLPRAPALAYLGVIAARTNDIDAAREVFTPLQAFTGQQHWISVDRALGMLAATLEDWPAAEGYFEASTEMLARGGTLPELAITIAEHGAALIRAPLPEQRARAESLLTNGISRLRALEMNASAARYEHILAAATTTAVTPSTPAGLTAREAEVLALVAEGKTNREIADTLNISEKTVTNHLTHVFTKANVDNRSAAVAFAIRHGLAR